MIITKVSNYLVFLILDIINILNEVSLMKIIFSHWVCPLSIDILTEQIALQSFLLSIAKIIAPETLHKFPFIFTKTLALWLG